MFLSFAAVLVAAKRSIIFITNLLTSLNKMNTFETEKESLMRVLERTISMTLKKKIESTQRRKTLLLNLIKMLTSIKILIPEPDSCS